MKLSESGRALRRDMLCAAHLGRDGNLQSCFSSTEILWTLYDSVMRLTPESVVAPGHDRFILSKGQSTLALMAVLASKGYIPIAELDSFCRFDARIAMQADRTKFEGIIENSAGSLGHGFPIAVGLAWGEKIKGSDAHVYVLAGDGEMNEGTMWEAALFAASERLDNLTLIIDDNHSIGRMIHMGDLADKLRAFGFTVFRVDGHNEAALRSVLMSRSPRAPVAVLADTIRGYGSDTLMEDRSWFHRWPDGSELQKLLAEVDAF